MNTELIDDFLSGKLSENERIKFEERLKFDKALVDEVAFIIATKHFHYHKSVQQKKEDWKKLYQENNKKAKFSVSRAWTYTGTFAAAACLILLIYQFIFINNPTSQEYVASYISTNYTTLSTQMGTDDGSISSAVELYNNKQYDQALKALDLIQANAKVLEYKGLTELQLKNYEAALTNFQEMEKMEDSVIKKAPFYQAITLIELNREKEAKVILEKIIKEPNLFGQKEAKELLKLL